MKITFFIGGLYGGGAERVTCNLANMFSDKGYDVDLISMTEEKKTYYISDTVCVKYLISEKERKGKLWNFFLRYIRLKNYVKHNNPDAYVVMLPITTIMLLSLKRFIKVPIIVSERADPNFYSGPIKYLLRKMSGRATRYVFQTHTIESWYIDFINKNSSYIIGNPISDNFLLPQFQGERNGNIVAVGRLSTQKNFELLIKAFSRISGIYPHTNVYIYGEGENRARLETLIAQHNLEGRVFLLGQVNELAAEIISASVFVLPSIYEGMPNSLIEAMALGIPCIATDCGGGGARALIENKKNGLLIESDNENMLVSALQIMLDNPDFAEEMGKNARNVREKFSKEVIADLWEKAVLGS